MKGAALALTWLMALLSVATATTGGGCASSAVRESRRWLDQGQLQAAAKAAGTHPTALRHVALATLAQGLAAPETRRAAAQGLVGARDLARSTLRRLSQDEAPLVAALAAEILVQQGSRRHRDQQSQRLQHPLAEVRAAAIRSFSWKALGVKTWRQALYAPHEVLRRAALTRRAADDVPPWAIPLVAETARRDPVHAVRRQALRALGQIAPAAVVPVARQSLQSPDRPIRLAALTVLAPLGDNETVRALWRQCLGHGEPVEQIRAATLLARQGETDGLASLRQWLKVPQVAWARAALLGAGQVGTPLHPEIRQALARPEPAVRLQAAVALIDADDDEGGQQAREVLVELLDRPGWLGLQAARALGEQGAETEGPLRAAVVRALESDEPALQVAAVGLLAPWSPRAKIPLLAPLLRGAAPLVRVAAAGALVAAPSR